MTRTIIHTDAAPKAVGPYSQGVRVGEFIFTAGQIGLDPATSKLREGLEAQTHQIMSNLEAILQAAGASLETVVKTTVFLADMASFQPFNAIYGSYFKAAPPARSTFAVAGLPLGALVEVEVVAVAV